MIRWWWCGFTFAACPELFRPGDPSSSGQPGRGTRSPRVFAHRHPEDTPHGSAVDRHRRVLWTNSVWRRGERLFTPDLGRFPARDPHGPGSGRGRDRPRKAFTRRRGRRPQMIPVSPGNPPATFTEGTVPLGRPTTLQELYVAAPAGPATSPEPRLFSPVSGTGGGWENHRDHLVVARGASESWGKGDEFRCVALGTGPPPPRGVLSRSTWERCWSEGGVTVPGR